MFLTPWIRTVQNRLTWSRWLRKNRRHQKLSTSAERRMNKQAELLEARTLLTSPQFVSVSPNVGTFLQDGDVRDEIPQELLFQFTPGQTLDAASLDAINVYAAGADNQFRSASALTDFGTNGAVVLRVGTQRLGDSENGSALTITTAATGLGTVVTGSTPTNEIQELSLPATFTGTDFTLTFNLETTATINFNATAAQVQTALDNLPSITPGDLIVRGGPLGTDPISIEFGGAFAQQDVSPITVSNANLQNNETQAIALTGDPTGGTFQLGFNDAGLGVTGTSDPINYNDDAAAVQAAIISGIPALTGLVSVTGIDLPSGPVTIEFIGAAADLNVAPFSVAAEALTGGTTPSVSISTVADGNLNASVATLATGTTGFLNIELDSATPTTAQDLINLANSDPVVSQLLSVEHVSGNLSQSLLGANVVATLAGAGAAAGVSEFDTGTDLRVQFIANTAGLAGNDIRVQINRLDLGALSAAPRIDVVGNLIRVIVNENPAATTTALDLVTALNADADANALITASVAIGSDATTLETVTDGSVVQLSGADQIVTPGYRAVAAKSNEVEYRFGDQLADDLYLIQIAGTGAQRLTNTAGEALGSLTDHFQTFRIDLGGEVRSIVPQPVLREKILTINAGTGANPSDLQDGDTITIDSGVSLFARDGSDLGSGGAVNVSFESVVPGVAGNGITVNVTSADLGAGTAAPTVTAGNRNVTIVLNTNIMNPTTARDLADGVAANLDARSLIAVVLTGDTTTEVGTTLAAPEALVLAGGLGLLTFEINDTGAGPAGVRTGNFAVDVALTADSEIDIAGTIATAINDAITAATNLDVPNITASNSGTATLTVIGDSLDVSVNASLSDSGAMTRGEGGLQQRRDRVVVYFNDVDLDDTDVYNPRFYQLIDTAGTSTATDDQILIPSGITYDRATQTAVLDFGGDLPTATYRLQVGSSNDSGDNLASGLRLGTLFVGSGFNANGFIGDSSAAVAEDDADLYRFTVGATGTLTAVVNPSGGLDSFIELLSEGGANVGGAVFAGGGVDTQATLTAAGLVAGTYFVRVTSNGGATTGSYNLDISTTAADPVVSDDNDSYSTATDIGTIGAAGITLSSQIEPQTFQVPPLPNDGTPGHRDIPAESHGAGTSTTPAAPGRISQRFYNFREDYGSLFGIPQDNQITEGQKDLARYIFEIFSRYSGVQFIETAQDGTYIATGDVRVADETLPVNGVAGISTVIINALQNGNDESYNGGWMGVAFHEIAHVLGLGHTGDIHSFQDGGGASPVTTETPASDYDINHLQALFPFFANDIDLYRFELTETGTVNAEITAERLAGQSRLLDAVLTLFRDPFAKVTTNFGGTATSVEFTAANAGTFGNDITVTFQKSDLGAAPTVFDLVSVSGHSITVTLNTNAGNETTADDLITAVNTHPLSNLLVSAALTAGNGTDDVTASTAPGTILGLGGGNREVVARNDDYFSDDPFLSQELEAGVYYLGVSAKGNDAYDPTIEDSGYGGLTDGNYDLNVTFSPSDSGSSLADADASPTAFDGNSDGIPGDAFNFWFESGSTVFVDKTTGVAPGAQNGSVDAPYSTIEAGVLRASTRIVVPANGRDGLRDGIYDTSDGSGFIGGEYFTISDGVNPARVFEFDAAGDGVVGSNVQIDLSGLVDPTDRAEIATAIAAAVNGQLSPTFLVGASANAAGHVDLNNAASLDASTAPGLLTAANLLRIVGNGGADGDNLTPSDTTPYLIGINNVGGTLADGRNFDVPQGVTTMIDAGAVLKLQSANIDVGSSSVGQDRQDAALQVLGTPDSQVYFTTFRDDSLGGDTDGASSGAIAGQWGGLVFREDSDQNDTTRGDDDENFVFLNSIYQADIRFGGGQVAVNSVVDVYAPVHIEGERPTIAYNHISSSASSAVSADPNSFDDSNGRIGPDILGNTLTGNTVNGLFIRIETNVGDPLDKLTTQARFDDTDITHVITENLQIVGNAGGGILTNEIQELSTLGTATNGTFTLSLPTGGVTQTATALTQDVVDPAATGIFVDSPGVFPPVDGSPTSIDFTIQIGTEILGVQNVVGNQLTVVRGLYGTTPATYAQTTPVALARTTIPLNHTATAAEIQTALENIDGIGSAGVTVTGGPINQGAVTIEFIRQVGSRDQVELVINNAQPAQAALVGGRVIVDTITDGAANVPGGREITARQGGRLRVDPGVVVKLGGARIEAERGSGHIIAEGTGDNPVIFTSLNDDRYGAGSGTFDTSNNGFNTISANTASAGDWAGLMFGVGTRGHFEQVIFAYGGGTSVVEGGGTGGFNVLDIHEADIRVANSLFENNANGRGGTDADRNNRETNDAATIFVRGAQPIIVNNEFLNNAGSVISIDANAMKEISVVDTGAATRPANAYTEFDANQGPLVRLNRMSVDGTPGNAVLGLEVRSGDLDTATIWDDTDIVHVVESGTIRNNYTFHVFGGLKLVSDTDASLVVKMGTGAGFEIGNPDSNGDGTPDDGPLDIDDRIGPTMQIIGQPGFPVIITSLRDDEVGAALDVDGFPQVDTQANGFNTNAGNTPSGGNWGEIAFNKYSNDTNMAVVFEAEPTVTGGLDENAVVTPTTNTAEFIGALAATQSGSSENERAGFEIHGVISPDSTNDVDIYSFTAVPGTEVWLDIDHTNPALDTVLELLNANGNIIARSQDNTDLTTFIATPNSLTKLNTLGGDFYATTTRDAGMRLVLPGTGQSDTYFLRVRSNPGAGNLADLAGGVTSGRYRAQIRLQQVDQQPGVSVTFADIRYATNGIHVIGLPYNSPLTGQTNEAGTNDAANNTIGGAIELGNLLFSEGNSFSAGGNLTSATDVDFYRFQIDYQKIQEITGLSDGGKTWAAIIDLDWADGLTRPDTSFAVYDETGTLLYIGRESNVADDQASPGPGNDLDDLSRGSAGVLDPFIGTAQFEEAIGTGNFYYLAVVNNQLQPTALDAGIDSGSANTGVRLEPVNSVTRIAEDHFGFTGYTSNGTAIAPVGSVGPTGPDPNIPLIGVDSSASLDAHITQLTLDDLVLFVSQDERLEAINPLTGAVLIDYGDPSTSATTDLKDIVLRSDGVLFGYQEIETAGAASQNTVGRLVTLDTGTGLETLVGNDNISGENPTPTAQNPNSPGAGNNDFDDITVSNNVGALTVERTGVTGGNPTYVGWYAVFENGTDVNGNPTVNTKLYRANLDTGAVANDTGDSDFGDIQFSDVVYADPANGGGIAFLRDSGGNTTSFHVQSKAAGAGGDGVILNLNANLANNGNINVTTPGNDTVTVSFGRNATAQSIVNAINQNTGASALLTIAVANGQNAGRSTGATGGASGVTLSTDTGGVLGPAGSPAGSGIGGGDGLLGPVRGNVTGLSFDTNTPNNSAANALYGVTDQGQLITIDRNNSDLRADAALVTNFSAGSVNSTVFFEQPNPDTITRATGSWIDDGFQVGDTITVTDSDANDNNYTIDFLSDTQITLFPTDIVGAAGFDRGITINSGGTFGTVRADFVDGGVAGVDPDLIVRTDGGSWLDDGFVGGDTITIAGSTSGNNGTDVFTIDSVTTNTITLDLADDVNDETAAAITISSSGVGLGQVPVTFAIVAGNADETISRRDGGNWLADGFAVGQTINLTGSNGDDGRYTIAAVSQLDLTVAGPTDFTQDLGIGNAGVNVTVSNPNLIPADGIAITGGFSALTLGPQNLYDGLLANTLFATTNDQRLIAFEVDGSVDGIRFINAFGNDNEVQTLTSTGTAGTFQLTYQHPITGETLNSLPIAFDATTNDVQNALQNMITTGGLRPFALDGSDLTVRVSDSIVRTDGGDWIADGFAVGDEITVTGSTVGANDGTFTIASITTDTLTLIGTDGVVGQIGETVTVVSDNVSVLFPAGVTPDLCSLRRD